MRGKSPPRPASDPVHGGRCGRHVNVSLTFQKDGSTVILSRIARHIGAVLQDVPDAQARAWAGVDAVARDQARQDICQLITERLRARYAIHHTPRPVIVPATGVWCGRQGTKPEEG